MCDYSNHKHKPMPALFCSFVLFLRHQLGDETVWSGVTIVTRLSVARDEVRVLLDKRTKVKSSLRSFPSAFQISEINRSDLHLSEGNRMLVTFPVKPVDALWIKTDNHILFMYCKK